MADQPKLTFPPHGIEKLTGKQVDGMIFLLLERMLPERPPAGEFQPTRYELLLDDGTLVTVEPLTKGAR